jgi:hypothetical protein
MGSSRIPFFLPTTATRKYLIRGDRIDSYLNLFLLKDHILAFSAVTRGGETITANVELYADYNQVATQLRLTDDGISWYSTSTAPQFVQVTGVFGWHEDYTNAFDAVDEIQANINATVTSLTVADVDGADLDGVTPRISAGNYIKINSEIMLVTATNTTTNVCAVRRGQLGTTAAAHTANDDVSTYRVDERIRRVAARQAALLYARKGAFQVETLDGVGVVTYPQDLLMELQASLTEFVYV